MPRKLDTEGRRYLRTLVLQLSRGTDAAETARRGGPWAEAPAPSNEPRHGCRGTLPTRVTTSCMIVALQLSRGTDAAETGTIWPRQASKNTLQLSRGTDAAETPSRQPVGCKAKRAAIARGPTVEPLPAIVSHVSSCNLVLTRRELLWKPIFESCRVLRATTSARAQAAGLRIP